MSLARSGLEQPLDFGLVFGFDLRRSAQVFAGGAVHAVLPFAGISRTMSGRTLASYEALLGRATVEVLDVPGDEEEAYMAAGERVVELSERMLAVWNGRPAKGRGGTADAVAFALQRGVPLVHINPVDRTVTRHSPAGTSKLRHP